MSRAARSSLLLACLIAVVALHMAFLSATVRGRDEAATSQAAATTAMTRASAPAAPTAGAPQASRGGTRGGSLVATLRSEPRSFNPHASRDFASHVVSLLIHARLVRINRVTQQVEPSLAESFSCATNGLKCTLNLRAGTTWSDGTPLTAADVLFSLKVAQDETIGSWLTDGMSPGGKPLTMTSPKAGVVVVTFGAPYGPGLRVLDALPILPRHKLEASLAAGTFRKEWGPATPPASIVGAGPFMVSDYKPGERVVFVRNPRYWKKDATGTQLPYLDRLTAEICPDQNTELLRLQAGQADVTQSEIRADDYAVLKREAAAGKLLLIDAGIAYDTDAFWFNLKPSAKANDPRRAWLQSLALRKAVSHAVNRRAFADAVFLGAAEPQWGPVTPSNRLWFAPEGVVERHAYDVAKARTLLGTVGLKDTNGDGLVEDASKQPARFTLITLKGNTSLEKGAAIIRDELKAIGLTVDVVALEVGALVERMTKADYDALYFRFLTTDTDPAMNMDLWLSSGGAHVWHLEQPTPGTPWEKAIDAAMHAMAAESNLAARQKHFYQAQKLLSDNLPIIYFAAPRVFVAVSTRVTGVSAAPSRPSLLWNAEGLGVRR